LTMWIAIATRIRTVKTFDMPVFEQRGAFVSKPHQPLVTWTFAPSRR